MAPQTNPSTGLIARIHDEVDHITKTFETAIHVNTNDLGAAVTMKRIGPRIITVKARDGGIDHIYADGQILVRDLDRDAVIQVLGNPEPEPQRVIRGVVLLPLDPSHGTVEEVLDRIDNALGAGVATPDHVLTVTGEVGCCPATEPQEVYYETEPFPAVCHENSGTGVLMYIGDTGLLEDAPPSHSWLAGVQGKKDPNSPDPPARANEPASIQPYTGHGTFVAGVARCMAPAADVFVDNVFAVAGSSLESDMVRELENTLGRGCDIVQLSVASPTRKDHPLIAFREWLGRLRHHKGVVCVAPAGNNESRRPHWPAAFSDVVSVGALAGDWRSRAEFSNFGGWVDVYAPGRNLINAYATGRYTCKVKPYKGKDREFYGMAQWSGTSFAAPVVTGLIAARMSHTGENGQEAAAALLQEARSQAIPGVGAVLLPRCGQHEARAASPADGGRTQRRSSTC